VAGTAEVAEGPSSLELEAQSVSSESYVQVESVSLQ
jgi:hypothetical protein